jgi:hypothetical protein
MDGICPLPAPQELEHGSLFLVEAFLVEIIVPIPIRLCGLLAHVVSKIWSKQARVLHSANLNVAD